MSSYSHRWCCWSFKQDNWLTFCPVFHQWRYLTDVYDWSWLIWRKKISPSTAFLEASKKLKTMFIKPSSTRIQSIQGQPLLSEISSGVGSWREIRLVCDGIWTLEGSQQTWAGGSCTRVEPSHGNFPALCFHLSSLCRVHADLEPDSSCSPVLRREGPWLSVSQCEAKPGSQWVIGLGTVSSRPLGETSRLCCKETLLRMNGPQSSPQSRPVTCFGPCFPFLAWRNHSDLGAGVEVWTSGLCCQPRTKAQTLAGETFPGAQAGAPAADSRFSCLTTARANETQTGHSFL